MTQSLATYLTTEQVADALGITTGRVRQIARALNLGTMVGRGRLYSPEDVEVMRARKTRPGPDPASASTTAPRRSCSRVE